MLNTPSHPLWYSREKKHIFIESRVQFWLQELFACHLKAHLRWRKAFILQNLASLEGLCFMKGQAATGYYKFSSDKKNIWEKSGYSVLIITLDQHHQGNKQKKKSKIQSIFPPSQPATASPWSGALEMRSTLSTYCKNCRTLQISSTCKQLSSVLLFFCKYSVRKPKPTKLTLELYYP